MVELIEELRSISEEMNQHSLELSEKLLNNLPLSQRKIIENFHKNSYYMNYKDIEYNLNQMRSLDVKINSRIFLKKMRNLEATETDVETETETETEKNLIKKLKEDYKKLENYKKIEDELNQYYKIPEDLQDRILGLYPSNIINNAHLPFCNQNKE